MGIFSRFEDKMEDTVEDAASRVSKAPISPVQIAKKAERRMRRETMVGAGKEYAPTLYTVLVNSDDDQRLLGYYPTLAGEIETYLQAKANQAGLAMDGSPLVRFIVDGNLRRGKFDVVAEIVAAPLVAQLRHEEMAHYGLAQANAVGYAGHRGAPAANPGRDYGAHGQGALARDDHDDFDGFGRDPGSLQGFYDEADGFVQAPMGSNAQARLFDLRQNRPFDLQEGATIILGRDKSCDIRVSDVNVSRRHAQLSQSPDGAWVVTDLNSTNGTLVNGQPVNAQPLFVGDILTIGKADFEFELA